MRLTRWHWSVALGAAVLVHGAVAVALLWQSLQSGAVGAGIGGIEVALGPAGGAPGSEAQPIDAITEAQEPAPEAVSAAPLPEAVSTAAVARELAVQPVARAAAPAPTRPVPRAEVQPREASAVQAPQLAEPLAPQTLAPVRADAQPLEAPAAQEPQLPEPVLAQTRTPPVRDQVLARPVAPPPPKPVRKPVPAREAKAEPVPETVPTPEPAAAKPVRVATAAAPRDSAPNDAEAPSVAAPAAAGTAGKSGTRASEQAGSAEAATAGGLPGAAADYFARLQAWLEKHKEYPRRARMRRQQGTALLAFVIDREGRVLEHRLQRSSGHSLLDHEVQAMIERSQPLPRMPEEMQHTRLELVVPVQFFLR